MTRRLVCAGCEGKVGASIMVSAMLLKKGLRKGQETYLSALVVQEGPSHKV